MSQTSFPSRDTSLAPSDMTSGLSVRSSTDPGDTGSIFRAPRTLNSQATVSQAPLNRPKRTQHQAQLSFNMVSPMY